MHSIVDEIRPVTRIFYLLGGYGQTAVIIFFVLSGYLVGGSVIRATTSGHWSWVDYLLARGVRLYVVLVPALLLTVIWDQVGLKLVFDRPGNDDTAKAIITTSTIIAQSGPIIFVGNLAFLETIVVPCFGSNVPLWSLANEAWYYLIFPCLWRAGSREHTTRGRIFLATIGLAMLAFVGPKIASLLPVWLLGVGLAMLPQVRLMESRWSTVLGALSLIIVLGLVGLRKIPDGLTSDYTTAISFSLFLYAILHHRQSGGSGWYARLTAMLAGCSYTLYLTHLPILICLRAIWTNERPWPPDLAHWGMVWLICLGCLAYAYGLSLFFEAKTDWVRQWLVARFREVGKFPVRLDLIREPDAGDLIANVQTLVPSNNPVHTTED